MLAWKTTRPTHRAVSQGYTVILVVVDWVSNGCRFIPFRSLPSALQVIDTLFCHVYCCFRLPEEILFDWKAFFRKLGVAVSLTLDYHSESNSQAKHSKSLEGSFGYAVKVGSMTGLSSWSGEQSWVPARDVLSQAFVEELNRSWLDLNEGWYFYTSATSSACSTLLVARILSLVFLCYLLFNLIFS